MCACTCQHSKQAAPASAPAVHTADSEPHQLNYKLYLYSCIEAQHNLHYSYCNGAGVCLCVRCVAPELDAASTLESVASMVRSETASDAISLQTSL